MANFAAATMAGFFQKRSQGGTANIMSQDGNTEVFVKVAFNEGGGNVALQALNSGNGYYANLGTPSHALYANGPVSPFTGAHDGLLNKLVTPTPGDIMVDLNIIASKGVSDSIATIELSSRSNQPAAIGIYVDTSSQIPVPLLITVEEATEGIDGPSTTTVQKLNPIYESLVETHNYVIINSLGEGQINVCGEAGTIELGDLIVTSSVPGKGMRQSDDIVRSTTVAKARETVTFDSPTQVKQIACIYLCG
jgi:hypothetical protein